MCVLWLALPKQSAKTLPSARQFTTDQHHQLDNHAHPLHSTPIVSAMFVQRSAIAAARRVAPRAIATRRTFTTTFARCMFREELSYDVPLTL
jgi:hypothetical protein